MYKKEPAKNAVRLVSVHMLLHVLAVILFFSSALHAEDDLSASKVNSYGVMEEGGDNAYGSKVNSYGVMEEGGDNTYGSKVNSYGVMEEGGDNIYGSKVNAYAVISLYQPPHVMLRAVQTIE